VDEHDHEWGLREFGTGEPDSFSRMVAGKLPASGVRAGTLSGQQRSARPEEFMKPNYGFTDELRALCLDERGWAWAGLAVFRQGSDPAFSPDEVAYLGSLGPSFALGMRSGLLASLAAGAVQLAHGPIVLIVDAANQLSRASVGAEQRLAELASGPLAADASGLVGSLVGAARRYARGELAAPPRSRIRAADGRWLVLHAAPLNSADGTVGEVAVTIEEARPAEIVPLVVAAFGLTGREQEIVQLILQGLDTKDIATRLFLSAFTVQDHLKAVFEKAGVRSRRELVARIYFDQYVPRTGSAVGPSGWFVE